MLFKNIHKRMKIALLIIFFVFIVIILRVFYIQVIDYKKLNKKASDLWSRNLPIKADRGLIYDRNGVILADNATTTSLVVIPNQIKNKNLPPWVLVRVMTFGNIKQFYYLLKTEEKEKVAKLLEVDRKYLYTYLQILNVIRNICAHGDVLFNVRLQYKLSKYDNKERERLKIRKINGDYEYGTNDMFAVILTLKKLLDQEDFIPLFLKIENRIKQVQQEIDEISFQYFLKELGFPKNYKQIKMM